MALLRGFSHTAPLRRFPFPTAQTSRFTGKHTEITTDWETPSKVHSHAARELTHPLGSQTVTFQHIFHDLFTLIRDYVA